MGWFGGGVLSGQVYTLSKQSIYFHPQTVGANGIIWT